MSVKLLAKYLPGGRVAVFPVNRTECGEYQPPTPLGFYPQENWCSYEEEKRSYLAEIEEELELPPMGLERTIGLLAILYPLTRIPEAQATCLSLPDDIPF